MEHGGGGAAEPGSPSAGIGPRAAGGAARVSPAPSDCCLPRAMWGWCPPTLPATTPLQRRLDRLLPRTGAPAVLYFLAVAALLCVAARLPLRPALAVDGLAAASAGAWCGVNFLRCRHAHCLVSGPGWLILSLVAWTGAVLGRSLLHGDDQLAFVGVLLAALAFEAAWSLLTGGNAIGPRPSVPV